MKVNERNSKYTSIYLKRMHSQPTTTQKWKSDQDFIYVDSLMASFMFSSTKAHNKNYPFERYITRPPSKIPQNQRLVKVCERTRTVTPTKLIAKTGNKAEPTYVSIDIINRKIEVMEEEDKRIHNSNWKLSEQYGGMSDYIQQTNTKNRHKIANACKRAKSALEKMKQSRRKSALQKRKATKARLSSTLSKPAANIIERQLKESRIRGNSKLFNTRNLSRSQNDMPVVNVTSNITVKDIQNVLTKKKAFVMDIDDTQMQSIEACCKISENEKTKFERPDYRRTTLRDIIGDKGRLEDFRYFLRSEYSEENLEFWFKCVSYRTIKSPKLRWRESRRIFDEFLAPYAPKEVNLDSKVKRNTRINIEFPDENTFSEAQLCVYNLMEKDSFRRFMNARRHTQC
ncbi:uncharacterized protein LOC120344359 [Styela clava]